MHYIKTLLLAAWLLLWAGASMAQTTIYLEPRVGFGTFRMQPLKDLQRAMIVNSGINAKATDTYGPYFQFGFNVVSGVGENLSLGVLLEHGSTGGRIAYADYSGEFTIDSPVNYNALGGLFYHHQAISESRLRYVIGAEFQMLKTTLKLQGSSRIYNVTERSEDRFDSFGLSLKPFAGLQYPLLKLPTTLSMGYLADVNTPFHVPGELDQQLVRSGSNEPIKPVWSGLRLNLAVSIPIARLRR